MPTISEKMKARKPQPKPQPVWSGPEGEGWNGGVTQSMIGRWLSCRERARVRWIEGLSPPEQFSHRIEYGNMWHLCEETRANGQDWEPALKQYAVELCAKYPTQQAEIEKWWNVCKVQFPIYVAHWNKHPETVNRTPLLAEQVFDVPYKLPSGRTVRLRGKWDGLELAGKGKDRALWVPEHKTKGDVDLLEIQRQLSFDLQTLTYLIALESARSEYNKGNGQDWIAPLEHEIMFHPLKGVRFNVIRRPLSGGEGMITQKKGSKNVRPETSAEYYDRLRGVIDGTGVKTTGENYAGPEHWFFRWTAEVSAADLKRFRERCLDPILEQMCCWYGCVTGNPQPVPAWAQNYQHPHGNVNTIDEFGSSDLDSYLATGSRVGLTQTTLFRELK